MKFDTLMFDADDTLFDFYSSGKKCFTETALEWDKKQKTAENENTVAPATETPEEEHIRRRICASENPVCIEQ